MDIFILIVLGLAAGTLGSLLGLGGGFLVVPALILLKGVDPRIASGTSVAVIVPAMAIALWRRGAQGHVDVPVALWMALGAIAGAFVGSWLAGVVDAKLIRRLFAGVLIVLAALLVFGDGGAAKRESAVAPTTGGSRW